MSDLSIAARPGEPLAAWFGAEARAGDLIAQVFECTSFGDRVVGRVWRSERATPDALVLVLHALGSHKGDAALAAAARVWARAGAATAAIDLPLHGERHNAKLSRRAVEGARGETSRDRALWQGLVAQAVRDLARALDALATLGPLPPVSCVAFGDSAPIAQAFAGLDGRVGRVAALGPRRAGPPADPANPLRWLARPDDLELTR